MSKVENPFHEDLVYIYVYIGKVGFGNQNPT
jgi:hypothetical protein